MKSAATILVAVILVAALGIMVIMPPGNVNTTGLVLLIQNKEDIDDYFEDGKLKQPIVNRINLHTKNVPEQLFELFGNNRINIFVGFDDGSVHDYHAQTSKNRLSELSIGARSLADVEIRVKESTIDRLVLSEKSFEEFLGAMNSGEIKYRGLTFEGSVKSATVSVTTTVLGFVNSALNLFGNLFG